MIMNLKGKRRKVGLALGSGGWRGLAHLGVIKVLEEEGITIDYVAGSSAGALVGGAYCALADAGKLEEIMGGLSYRDLVKALADPYSPTGILRGEKVTRFLRGHLGERRIEELKIPFRAVTTDLRTGEEVILKEGDLNKAIRASMSVPLLFEPVQHEGRYLVDGATVMPVPVKVVREMGAEMVIAVNLYGHTFPVDDWKEESLKRMRVLKLSYHLVLHELAQRDIEGADLVLEPRVVERGFNIFLKIVNNNEAIIEGERVMKEKIEEIKKLIEY